MELLTGKAKEDFEKWNRNIEDNDHGYIDIEPTSINVGFEDLYPSLQNNIIINWLDSVGIYVTVSPRGGDNSVAYWFNDAISSEIRFADTRHEATTEAIKQANIIYNESN